MQKEDELGEHFRLMSRQVSALKRLGIATIGDLLYHFPARYESGGGSGQAGHLQAGESVTLYGMLSKLQAKRLWKSKRTATEGWFEDGSGRVKVMWFNQPYIAKMAPQGVLVRLTGVVGGGTKPYIANPAISPVSEEEVSGTVMKPEGEAGVFAMYPESRGVTSLWFRHALQRVLKSDILDSLDDPLPEDIRTRYNLPSLSAALTWMHAPEKDTHAAAAKKRFAFEEIFSMQVAQARERAENDKEKSFEIKNASALAETFIETLPHEPTGAQHRAIRDIFADFENKHPMARLLEGDVGSGKTLVAAAVAYAVVHSRPMEQSFGTLQVAYMAPTEILATQHFASFCEYFKDAPIKIALITGSGCKKFPSKSARGKATDISRTQLLKWVAQGEIALVVGTHSLIQKAVRFKNLACAIVDEQHRFGTAQRRALTIKGERIPHFLSMTATPIPRTLALTLYGDLDLSILDELPAGRAKVTTKIVTDKERKNAYTVMREELEKGRQAYVICPRINEPDPAKMNALQAKSAKAEAKRLQADIFPDKTVGLLHGAMKTKDKDEVMRAFAAHEIDILVATSVVEVGINVPNATVILIEGAERFGLSQLHQIRGRVQRSSHAPTCFLLPETHGEKAMKRLKALEKSDNGFELAEADLRERGAGDLYGRSQWGMSDLGMEALQNVKLIRTARDEAYALVKKDPTLSKHPALLARVMKTAPLLHRE